MLNKAKEFASKSPIPSSLDHELSKQVLPDYFLEPGDRLSIEPTNLESKFQSIGDQVVLVDGSVDLGKFGRIRVAGFTAEMVEQAVAEQIMRVSGLEEVVNVQLIETNGSRIYVLGAVGSPGAYELRGRETVLDAILLAGGLTSKASPCDIIFVRPTNPDECRVVQRICYRQIAQLGDVSTNYQLQPSDRIIVGQRTFKEELAFWKQTTACPCCDRSRCIQCDPSKENYRNRFVTFLNRSPLPEVNLQKALADDSSDKMRASRGGADSSSSKGQAPIVEKSKLKSKKLDDINVDSDFYLPRTVPARPDSANRTKG
ncbi:MAG TPA: polysaccharide biosynthesis/export family protein [Pirellula sp.]|nr:polysaccharide biosynthesis/export family protein [Pirellula sp.]